MEMIMCFLDEHSSALTVIVTAIYTLTTIAILLANRKAAKAAKEQVLEMQRQFVENCRARIEVEVIFERRCFYGLRFVNNGMLTAQNVRISFEQSFIDSIEESNFAENLAKQKDKTCIIGTDQHYDIFIGTSKYRQNPNKVPAQGTVYYNSNGTEYNTVIYVDMENYATFYSITSEEEDIRNETKAQTSALINIDNSICKLIEEIQKGQ